MMDIVKPATTLENALSTTEGVCDNATILDGGYQVCPWCGSEVRHYFINFNEKLLMCENAKCDYPFGHENFIIVKENNNAPPDEELSSIESKSGGIHCSSPSATISTSGWSEVDKLSQVNDVEDEDIHRSQSKGYFTHKNNTHKIKQAIESRKKILKEVEAIKKLSLELSAQEPVNSDPKIKNEKWIKNLMNKEKLSGVSLLEPEEVKLFKTKSLDIGSGELKIDIDMGNEKNMSSIRIELANT